MILYYTFLWQKYRFDHPEVFAAGEDATNDVDKPPKPTTALYIYIDIKANEEKKKCTEVSTFLMSM